MKLNIFIFHSNIVVFFNFRYQACVICSHKSSLRNTEVLIHLPFFSLLGCKLKRLVLRCRHCRKRLDHALAYGVCRRLMEQVLTEDNSLILAETSVKEVKLLLMWLISSALATLRSIWWMICLIVFINIWGFCFQVIKLTSFINIVLLRFIFPFELIAVPSLAN